ncbi:hypothetical protein, partial [Clostridium sp.]|uniref:hypothetical protein n=1 Tax=Clostridium sp. TaxID=1506 RepID=UPI0025C60167
AKKHEIVLFQLNYKNIKHGISINMDIPCFFCSSLKTLLKKECFFSGLLSKRDFFARKLSWRSSIIK